MRYFMIVCSLLGLLVCIGCDTLSKVEDQHTVQTPEGTTTTTETTKVQTDEDQPRRTCDTPGRHEPGECPKNADGTCACPKNGDGTCQCCPGAK